MTGRVEVLLERLLATEQSIAVVAFEDVSGDPEVLTDRNCRIRRVGVGS